jgi:hypothetical protein
MFDLGAKFMAESRRDNEVLSSMNAFSVLGASSQEHAVWLSFGFYLLNLLVPIIPAVIIYWLFPETKTNNTVEGSIGAWKIKAIGAWGAYVTAFLLGFWAINSTAVPLIRAVGGASVWTIDSDFQLTDESGKDIEATVDKLEVEPPMVKPWGKHATIKVFSETLDPPDMIRIKMDGYDYQMVNLKGVPLAESGKIKLSTPIILKQLPPIASAPAPTPLPAGTGPATLTSNQ